MSLQHDQDFVRGFDRRDWDPGTERSMFGFQYRQRVDAIRRALKGSATGPRLVDLGCAQGNLAALLAEHGFQVTAVDRNPAFLEYARDRHPNLPISWVCSDLQTHRPDVPYDAALLGEVIEHTGTPEQLVDAVADMLAPGGVVVLTTPNGSRIRNCLPTFSEWKAQHPERSGWIQMGPAGEDHEYLFTVPELVAVLGTRFEVVTAASVSSALCNRLTAPAYRWSAGRVVGDRMERALLDIPFLRDRLANNLLLTARRR